MQVETQELRRSSSTSANKSARLRRLESFLRRVATPTYFRSTSPDKIAEDFDQARLDDLARLINQQIAESEHRRMDLTVLEVIESTMKKRTVPICERLGIWNLPKFSIPTMFSCIRTRSIQQGYQDLERAQGPPYSTSSAGIPATGKIDAQKLILQNEQHIHWFKKLQANLRGAASRRRRHRAPVYSVSQELWGYLFLFCLPDEGQGHTKNGEEYVEPDSSSSPLLLCRVCHAWRTAATRTPALWASLVIRLHGQSDTRKDLIQTWTALAGGLPLALHIIWGPTRSPECYDDILEYVRSLAGRWKSLKLSVLGGLLWQLHTFPSRARKLLEGSMPKLERLTLDTYVSFAGDVETIQRKAPRLRELVVENSNVNPMEFILAPWSGLAIFQSCFPLELSQAYSIFKHCHNLQECEVAVMACPVLSGPRTMLRMPMLKKLTINETTTDVLDALFVLLELPALEELNLHAGESSWVMSSTPWSAAELLFMVHRSVEGGDRKLKILRMRDIRCRDYVMERLRCWIPSLVALDMRFLPSGGLAVKDIGGN